MKIDETDLRDEKPVKMTVELPAADHADLVLYARFRGGEGAKVDLGRVVARMVAKFMKSDREFAKARRASRN